MAEAIREYEKMHAMRAAAEARGSGMTLRPPAVEAVGGHETLRVPAVESEPDADARCLSAEAVGGLGMIDTATGDEMTAELRAGKMYIYTGPAGVRPGSGGRFLVDKPPKIDPRAF